jgi:hypothetical protein
MFLRQYHRTKACPELRRDGKRHTYFALVESQRTERGPRQRIVAQLGELTRDQQRSWQRTAIFHGRHKACPEPRRDGRELPLFVDEGPASLPDDPDVVRIHLGKVGWTNARAFGDVWLGLQLWKKLGLDEIVARHVPQGGETVPPATMVAIEVISRLCVGNSGETSEFALAEPCPELRRKGYRRTALEDLLGVPSAQRLAEGSPDESGHGVAAPSRRAHRGHPLDHAFEAQGRRGGPNPSPPPGHSPERRTGRVTGRPQADPTPTPLCRPRSDRPIQPRPADRRDTPENVVKTSEKNRPRRYLQGRFTGATAQPGLDLVLEPDADPPISCP